MLHEPPDAARVVRPVPISPAPFESARKDALGSGAVDRLVDERARRGECDRERSDVSTSTRPSRARASSSHPAPSSMTVQPGRHGEPAAIACASSWHRRLERDSGQHDDPVASRTRLRRGVCRGRFDRLASTPSRGKATSAAVRTSNCVAVRRSAAERTAPSARRRTSGRRRGCAPPRADVRRQVRLTPSLRHAGALDHPRRRRLAVRPDHVHSGQARLRLAEPGEQRVHPLEAEAVLGPRRQRLQPRDVAHQR